MTRQERAGAWGLVGLWAFCWLPGILSGRTLPARDVAATQLPWRQEWRTAVLGGHLPLWDPASSGGRLMWANPNAMAAYPGTAAFLLGAPERVAVWSIAFHHLLFMAGCFALGRRAGASSGAALVGAAVGGFSGMAWSATTFLNFQASLAWLPWALAVVARPPRGTATAAGQALGSGTLLGLAFLGGEPVSVALAACIAGVVVLCRWPARTWATAALLPLGAIAMAGPVLVPLLAAFSETARGHLGSPPGGLGADALAPRRLIELMLPNLLGPPLADGSAGFWAAPSFPWQRYYPSVFLGAVPVVLAPWILRQRRELAPWLGMAAVGIGGAAALGIPPVASAVEGLPGSSAVRYGIKLLVLVVLALPPLVSAGSQGLQRGWSRGVRRGVAAALGVLALLALMPERWTRHALGLLYPASAMSLRAQPPGLLGAAMRRDLAGLALPVAGLAVAGPVPAVLAVSAALGGVLSGGTVLAWDDADSWAASPPAARLAPPAGRVVSLCRQGSPASGPEAPELRRFWAARSVLYPEYGVRWGLRYALAPGPDGLTPWRAELLARLATSLPAPGAARLGHALGADLVLSPEPVPGWRCEPADGVVAAFPPSRTPEAYMARRVQPAASLQAAILMLANETFRPGLDATTEGLGGVEELAGGEVHEESGPTHRRSFLLRADGPGLLVVGQSFMGGWRGLVDGQEVPLVPANGCQLGVRVPSGQHRVVLELRLTPYWVGGLGPLAALVTAVGIAVWRRRAR
ncbi:MAG: YfhO family protein [Thermoanaerobaculaceae bacterium]|jgi:hypothetical protein|nr:YfhO family protein [Thermoanaerobaculaceae bacterium]